MGRFDRDAEKMEVALEKVMQAIPESDQKLMRDPQIKQTLVAAFYESFRQGSKGPAHDGKFYGHPWGFPLEEMTLDKVYLWHGEHDVNVPVAMGHGVAKAIPPLSSPVLSPRCPFSADQGPPERDHDRHGLLSN